ncbi:prepilin-type N-terminal cleavage/methylation domain-containing protein [Candidatus Daviesbacteria bacterium]|nr:prepilin-type N-terminal cleavage/methylation domain-containing protein [Candidatus Daviesbacteria bacterium]
MHRGFTLVELLITVSIIAVLASISIGVFANIQKSSRDSKRKSDLAIVQGVLEQYRADQGFYPRIINAVAGANPYWMDRDGLALTNSLGIGDPVPPSIVRTYLQKLPLDPINNSLIAHPYLYAYFPLPAKSIIPSDPYDCDNTSGKYCTSYCLFTNMEVTSNSLNTTPCLSISQNWSGVPWDSVFNYQVKGL